MLETTRDINSKRDRSKPVIVTFYLMEKIWEARRRLAINLSSEDSDSSLALC